MHRSSQRNKCTSASGTVRSNNKTQQTVKYLFTVEILYLSHPHALRVTHVNGRSLQTIINSIYCNAAVDVENRFATKLEQNVVCIISLRYTEKTVHHVFKSWNLVIYFVGGCYWLKIYN